MQLTIVMYHYVRELQYTQYPNIKGLLVSQFKKQLAYLEKYYNFITIDDCNKALKGNGYELPSNSVLLTFDDAYSEHFDTVFPILNQKGIQGCFFPPAKSVTEHEVLDVNKLHFILASTSTPKKLVAEVNKYLDEYRPQYGLHPNDYYYEKLAQKSRFDTEEVIFIKRLLQVELEEKVRGLITDRLFKKYVTANEPAFARELYMSTDQIKCMNRNGMYIGSHGFNHYWLDSLSSAEQQREVDAALNFLDHVGAPTRDWVMCYPYGAFNDSLISVLKKSNCSMGLSTKVDIANLTQENAYSLERLDTNDLPKEDDALPAPWTKKVL